MDLESLPPVGHDLERLKAYQRNRALEEERGLVEAALAVPEAKRTNAQHNAIAYSKFGTAARTCH